MPLYDMRAMILAGAPAGISGADFETRRSTFAKNARKMEAEGLIFPGGHHKTLRYFDTPAKAHAWAVGAGAAKPRNVSRHKPRELTFSRPLPAGKPKVPKYKPGWAPWDPMHIPKGLKPIKCPPCRLSDPKKPIRTNTYSPLG